MSEVKIAPKIFAAVKEVLGEQDNFVPLHEPRFDDLEKELLLKCIDSTFVSSVGEYIGVFEEKLRDFTQSKHAIATVNGTSALHISMVVSGVDSDHEVLVPSLTFVATANAIAYTGAKPHFIDVEEDSLGVCPDKLRAHLAEILEKGNDGIFINKHSKKKVATLIVMHTFGNASDLDRIKDVCDEFNIDLIEDAAEALGTYYKEKHVGTFGKLGTLSFNGNKVITTGGGGAVLTNDDSLAEKVRHLTTTAKTPHRWRYFHDSVGFNYRMPNLNAALGVAQMEKLDAFLVSKKALFGKYEEVFKTVEGVELFSPPKYSGSNFWLQALVLSPEFKDQRDEVLEVLNDNGFMTRPCWEPLHTLGPFSNSPKANLDNTNDLVSRIINIPSSAGLV